MTIKDFEYQKEDGSAKTYSLLKIKEDTTSLEGISLRDLATEDRQAVLAVYQEFEDKLKPFMKHWRKFRKDRITKVVE